MGVEVAGTGHGVVLRATSSLALFQIVQDHQLPLLIPIGLHGRLPDLEMGEPGILARIARDLQPQGALGNVEAIGIAVEDLVLVDAGKSLGTVEFIDQSVPVARFDLGVHFIDGVMRLILADAIIALDFPAPRSEAEAFHMTWRWGLFAVPPQADPVDAIKFEVYLHDHIGGVNRMEAHRRMFIGNRRDLHGLVFERETVDVPIAPILGHRSRRKIVGEQQLSTIAHEGLEFSRRRRIR